jgi:hypothetical protein
MGRVNAVMNLSNPTHVCVVHCRQQADSTAGAQTPMRSGHTYRPLADILLPPAEERIDDIEEESDRDGKMRPPNRGSFQITTTGF